MTTRPLTELLRFHARAGARVALRNGALLISSVFVVFGMAPDGMAFLRAVALSVTARGHSAEWLAIFAAVGWGLARDAAPRVTAGYQGWIRTLPATDQDHRRAATIAMAFSESGMVGFMLLAMLGTVLVYRVPLAPVKLLAFPVIMLAAAAVAVPVTRQIPSRAIAVLALYAAARATWVGIAVSLVLLLTHDRIAGSLTTAAARPVRWGRGARWLPGLIFFRAIGWRLLVPMPAAVLMLAASYFYRHNNALKADDAAVAARWGGLLAITLYTAGLADLIVVRRPTWPWSRSLPTSGLTRVAHDAAAFALAAMFWVVVSAWLDWRSALITLMTLPLIAAVGAGAIRYRGERLTRAAGEMAVVGIPIAVAVAMVPVLALAALLLAVPALYLGAWRDSRLRVSRWRELHHDVAGDSAAWSAP